MGIILGPTEILAEGVALEEEVEVILQWEIMGITPLLLKGDFNHPPSHALFEKWFT